MEEEGDHIRTGLKSLYWVVRFLGILLYFNPQDQALSFPHSLKEANVYSGDNKGSRLWNMYVKVQGNPSYQNGHTK